MDHKSIMQSEKHPISRSYILYDFIYLAFLKWQNYRERNRVVVVGNSEVGGGLWLVKGLTKDVCDGLFCVLTAVVGTQIYPWYNCIGTHVSISACKTGGVWEGQWTVSVSLSCAIGGKWGKDVGDLSVFFPTTACESVLSSELKVF